MLTSLYPTALVIALTLLFLRKNDMQRGGFLSIDYTNFIRSVAILFVIIHHVGNYSGVSIFTPLGGIGVALFLMISGYGLNESYNRKGLSGFWKSKLIRVLIPCWLIDCIFAVINWRTFELWDFIQCLLCIKIDWYIRYLFYWYFAFYVFCRFVPQYRTLLMAITSAVMLCILPGIEAEQSLSFITGYLLSLHNINTQPNRWQRISFLFFVFGIGFLAIKQTPLIRELYGTIIYNLVELGLKWNIAFFIILFGYNLYKLNFVSRFLSITGLMSFELYLIHCKLLPLVRNGYTVLNITLFFVITYILSYILYRLDLKITKIFK